MIGDSAQTELIDRTNPRRHTGAGGFRSPSRLAPAQFASACAILVSIVAMCAGARAWGPPAGTADAFDATLAAVAPDGSPAEAAAHQHAGSGDSSSQGLTLAADAAESVGPGARCPSGAPVRSYDVVALAVDITLNRFLDHDPQGRMYALAADVGRVRAEEAENARARDAGDEPAVSIGLQGDAIQPLTLRVQQGECLKIRLTDQLSGEPANLHIHGSSERIAGTDEPATATNPRAFAQPGGSVDYEWFVPDDEPEGTHYFHSHGNEREQISHGLFGALIVETKGSTWTDPRTGAENTTGWDAIVHPANGPAFREFTLYYHEVGNENYQVLDRRGELVPQVDPLTSAYRPDGRALNYRSEPFMDRLQMQQQLQGKFDESLAYSSYAFGDPATPIMRSYLGDPVKQRLVHGGSEVFHVHHVHGGAIRWRRQPATEPSAFASGLDKHPPLVPTASERTDAQSVGPSETFDIEDECGSGGCQQSAGDFLVHCHVAEHYFAGMWTIWRVYNTRQDGTASTDSLPALAELPDRAGRIAGAVTSRDLAGRTVGWSGKQFNIGTGDGLAAWVERQLPPRGVPRGYDASVLDWTSQGDLYLGEPDAETSWPDYASSTPGGRHPLLFDPATGKLAYPFLRPHFGKRPPFAPNHGPAPFLDPTATGQDIPTPGANGPSSLCPDGTRPASYAINAITLPIPINEKNRVVDPAGEIFVLRDEEERVRRESAMKVPLAIRANAGEDCIDVLFRSELQDSEENHGFAKVNLHIHFAQFDVQASDGVDAGFNYEQSVRPYEAEGERMTAATAPGASGVSVASPARFQAGILVGIGVDQDANFEARRIIRLDGSTIVFDRPLEHPHAAGEIVSTEFVRYRWYPDAQFGTAYFHDHVNALASWKHGLFGALIAEPPGSSYHHPETGAPLRSGPIADIHTTQPVSVDVTGSFRELAVFIQDDNPLAHLGRSTGSTLNLRAEPPAARGGPPNVAFSSGAHGDPATPVLRSYAGDPLVFRTLVGGTNDVHTMHIDGHWFRAEPYSDSSPPIDTIHLGISERYDLVVPHAGGASRLPGDYLFYNGRSFKLAEGSWGILRVLDHADPALQLLPGTGRPAAASPVCPAGAPEKRFDLAAIDASLPMLSGKGKLYVLQPDKQAVLDGVAPPQPLVLHVNVGDCIKIELANETRSGNVSFHADMLSYDPKDSGGIQAGFDPPQDVAPGKQREYTFFADPQVGETVALVRDGADVTKNPALGLYGAIAVGPAGATFTDPVGGGDVSTKSAWNVVVRAPGAQPYRDFTLLFEDQDESIGTHRMPYTTKVSGTTAINYRAAPITDPSAAAAYRNDPPTPLLEAFAGDPVKLHVIAAASEQAQVFSLEEQQWAFEPGRTGTNMLSSVQVGGLEAITISLNSAGGPGRLAGDYLYGDHREPYREAGLWGIFRVYAGEADATIHPLTAGASRGSSWPLWAQAAFGVLLVVPLIALGWTMRRPRT